MTKSLKLLPYLLAFLVLFPHLGRADQTTAVFSCPPDYYAIYEPIAQQDDDVWVQKKDQASDEDEDSDSEEDDVTKGWHCYPLKDLKK
jgi:hypothetical protein